MLASARNIIKPRFLTVTAVLAFFFTGLFLAFISRAVSQDTISATLQEIEKIRQELIGVSKETQQQQDILNKLENQLTQLEQSEAEKIAALANQQQDISELLLILIRLSSSPPEALAFSQPSVVDTIRTAILVEATIQQLHQRSQKLQAELADLNQIRSNIAERRLQFSRSAEHFNSIEQKLALLLKQRQQWTNLSSTERQNFLNRINQITQDAHDLRELLIKFSELPPAPDLTVSIDIPVTQPDTTPTSTPTNQLTVRLERPKDFQNFPTRPGTIKPPVQGTIVGFYNRTYETGEILRGIFIETNKSAPIIAPFDGQVKYRGNFRSYGEIVILEHGRGYYTVLGGFGKIEAEIGQWFLAGEPLGTMPPSALKKPRLYLELRQQNQPIDPLPWLNLQQGG